MSLYTAFRTIATRSSIIWIITAQQSFIFRFTFVVPAAFMFAGRALQVTDIILAMLKLVRCHQLRQYMYN